MKNKLIDLNNHLFEQIERLNDDDIMQGDKFEKELQRSKAPSILALARLLVKMFEKKR